MVSLTVSIILYKCIISYLKVQHDTSYAHLIYQLKVNKMTNTYVTALLSTNYSPLLITMTEVMGAM